MSSILVPIIGICTWGLPMHKSTGYARRLVSFRQIAAEIGVRMRLFGSRAVMVSTNQGFLNTRFLDTSGAIPGSESVHQPVPFSAFSKRQYQAASSTRSSMCSPAAVAMFTSMSRLNRSILPRTRSETRGCVTPKI